MISTNFPFIAYVLFFAAALGFSLILNGILLKFVKTLGIRNQTDTIIRWNIHSKPAMGGISFYVIFLLSIIFYTIFWGSESLIKNKQMLGIIISCTIGFLMGLADDAYNTKPLLKFFAQISCAIVLIYTGTSISFFENQWLDYLLTIFWVVGIMNSINMLDNMDAITTCASIVIVLGVITVMYISGNIHNVLFVLSIGTLAALLGFLFFNWHPSKMFMGDTGSQFMGAFLSAAGIIVFWNLPYSVNLQKTPSQQIIIILLAFIVPIVDTTSVVINRLRKGQSPFVGGKDHTTHHLFYYGLSEKKIALLLSVISMVSVIFTILIMRNLNEWTWLYLGGFAFFFLLVFSLLYRTTRIKRAGGSDGKD